MSNERLLSDISKQNAMPTVPRDLSYQGNRFDKKESALEGTKNKILHVWFQGQLGYDFAKQSHVLLQRVEALHYLVREDQRNGSMAS